MEPLPLAKNATFDDLVFRPHGDGIAGHTHALHEGDIGIVSVTKGGYNLGEPHAPYEMMGPDGEIHAPLTPTEITRLLSDYRGRAAAKLSSGQ
jgi:hypothetical protein